MKKSKKVLLIVILLLAVSLISAGIVCYNLWPDLTKSYLNTAWEWLNEPLPVVGVPILMILIFLWKLFAASSLGKKQINEFKREAKETQAGFDALKQAYENKIVIYQAQINDFKLELEYYKEAYKELCNTIPNKKVKLLGAKYYAKEEANNKAKTE